MSIPPPNYNTLFTNLLEEARSCKMRAVKFHEQEKELSTFVLNGLSRLETTFSAEDFLSLEEREIKEAYSEMTHIVGVIFRSVRLKSDYSKEFVEECEHLCQSIDALKHALFYRETIDEFGLENFLDEDWAKHEFGILVQKKDPWALQCLEGILASNSSIGYQVLTNEGRNTHLIYKFRDDENLKEIITVGLGKGAHREDRRFSFECILSILQFGPCDWAKEILTKEVVEHLDPDAIEVVSHLFLHHRDTLSWIHDLVLFNFALVKGWAIGVVAECLLEEEDKGKVLELSQYLMGLGNKSVELQIVLAAYYALFSESHGFTQTFDQLCVHFERLHSGYPLEMKTQFDRLKKTSKKLSEGHFYFLRWGDLKISHQVNILRLMLRREQNLISVLLGKKNFDEFSDSPLTNSFPLCQRVQIGLVEGSLQEDRMFVNQIASILKKYGIDSQCFKSKITEGLGEDTHVEVVNGERAMSVWVRDLETVFPTQTRIPSSNTGVIGPITITYLVQDIREERMSRLYSDYSDRDTFEAIGVVNKDLAQLGALEYLLLKDPDLKSHSIQFTHNEGGNCLVGEEDGIKYALIGKDAREYSRLTLQSELAQIGLQKVEGRWALVQPYEGEEPSYNCRIEDEDLKFLFALDMGLEVEQVFFIEQPEYHLDVAMAIIDGKTVILNDSQMAFETWKRFAAEKMSRPDFEFDAKLYEKRLNDLEIYSKNMKCCEDACAKDLQEQGFNVIRLGGRFKDIFKSHPDNHQANFFNFNSYTVGDGRKVILAMGADHFFRNEFETFIRQIVDLDAIEYADQSNCENLLSLHGGIHCMTKEFAS